MKASKWAIALTMVACTFMTVEANAKAAKGPSYEAKGHYYETCACKVSCPCATNEFLPSEGHCDVAMLFHMDKASVSKTKLDGLNVLVVLKSPKNQKVLDAYSKGQMDHFAIYLDDKATEEQRKVMPQLLEALFGKVEIKDAKPPTFVPIMLSTEGDIAKLDVASGKLTFELENIRLAETKAGLAQKPKRIKMENVTPFPWMGVVTQGKSRSFRYTDGATKWDYADRNAYFGEFSTKGTVQVAAAAK